MVSYKEQKEQVDKIANDLNASKKVLDGMRDSIVDRMNSDGVRRVINEDIGMEMRMNVRKGIKVVDRGSVIDDLTKRGVDKMGYMDVSMPKVNKMVKELIKNGEEVAGVEQSESRYLSIKEVD